MIDKLHKWHRKFVWDFMYRFNLDEYHLAWISWTEGFVIGILLAVWLF